MAGRGRQSTLPAWMTAEGGAGVDPAVVSQILVSQQGQFDDQIKAEVRPSGQSNGESRPPSSRDERPATSSRDERPSRSSRDERPREDRPREDRRRDDDRSSRRDDRGDRDRHRSRYFIYHLLLE
jgi:hypothetical protein